MLLAVSPSPALESCGPLAQVYEPLAHDLFNAAFAAVWAQLGKRPPSPSVRGVLPAASSAHASPQQQVGNTEKTGMELRELLVEALMFALQSQHLPKVGLF